MKGFRLRPIRADEKAWARDLVRAVMRPHVEALWGWNQALQDRRFEDEKWQPHRHDIEVIEAAGGRAGWQLLESRADSLRLRCLHLEPEIQGRGIGRQALDVAKQRAARAGLPLRLSVLTPNRRALAFYLREGFEVIGQEEPRILMEWRGPES